MIPDDDPHICTTLGSRHRIAFLLAAVVLAAGLACAVVLGGHAAGRLEQGQAPAPTPGSGGAVGDRVWNDLNRNGLQEVGEPAIYDVEMDLLDAAGTVLQVVRTDASGLYTFTGLISGTYVVRVSPASFGIGVLKEWAPSPAFVGSDPAVDSNGTTVAGLLIYTVTVGASPGAGQPDTSIDFGLFADGKSPVGDYVWFDRNADGGWFDLPEEQEYAGGIDGVELRLYQDDGDTVFDPDPTGTGAAGDRLYAVASTGPSSGTPDTHGWYNFGVTYPAVYWLAVAPENFAPGRPLFGLTQAIDDPDAPRNLQFVLVPAQGNYFDADFGYAWMADLGVNKFSTPNPHTPGLPITYTVVVQNAGPGATTGLSLTEVLPSALLSPVFSPSTGVYTPVGGAWAGLSLLPGQTVSLTIAGLVPATSTIPLVNQVVVAVAGMIDPNLANNQFTHANSPRPLTDLAVTKADTPDPVTAGKTLTYTLVAKNNGPGPATRVAVTDTLPAGVTFVSSNPVRSSGPNPLVWQVGSLGVGASRTITVVVTVGAGASGTVTNTATVGGAELDPTASNNRVSVPTVVRAVTNLAAAAAGVIETPSATATVSETAPGAPASSDQVVESVPPASSDQVVEPVPPTPPQSALSGTVPPIGIPPGTVPPVTAPPDAVLIETAPPEIVQPEIAPHRLFLPTILRAQ